MNVAALQRAMPGLPTGRARVLLPHLQRAMLEHHITTPKRAAAFLAQLGHESVSLRYMEEIASGAAYEGRRDLGNTHPGDGRRFKGRGPIQLTGRANYRHYGQLLRLPLETHPQLAAQPDVGFRVAGLYWSSHGLNDLADRGLFDTITRRINGGQNGRVDRRSRWETCKRLGRALVPAKPSPLADDELHHVRVVQDPRASRRRRLAARRWLLARARRIQRHARSQRGGWGLYRRGERYRILRRVALTGNA